MLTGKSFSLGRYFDIDMRVDYSWFIIFFLIMFSLAGVSIPQLYPELGLAERSVLSVVLTLLFFASVALHELAHSLYAKRNELRIDRITFFLFGGAAEIKDEPPTPRIEFFMAAAGPLVSYLIAAIFAVVWYFAFLNDILYLQVAGSMLSIINFAVATFNLVPAYPLDGGRILRAIIWKFTGNILKSTRYAAALGRFFALLMMFYGFLLFFFGALLNGIWLILLGGFLHLAATQGYVMAVLKHKHGNTRIKDFMVHAVFEEARPTQLKPESTLMEAIEKMQNHSILYVGYGDKPVGFVTKKHISDIIAGVYD